MSYFHKRNAHYHRRYVVSRSFIGGGQFIHAPSTGGLVRTDNLSSPYYASRLDGIASLFE